MTAYPLEILSAVFALPNIVRKNNCIKVYLPYGTKRFIAFQDWVSLEWGIASREN